MSDVGSVLKAGGLVPTNAKVGKEDVVDTVVARAYSHPALPGRAVVRLTAENVVAGDDLEMNVLGFGGGEDRGAVAKERRRPLGFPGWPLVHDPKNARYALDVVGELKKHARKAKSKPGHAKEGIDALAAKLGKTVPHFLPSFFEEAGRAFLEHGAHSFAATMFAKAREAEAVHALEVEEQHRVDAFLEFALAGAVTTKALTEYSKYLGEHHKPAEAYAHFRQLCVQRTLGGMPPWAGMAKDLRRLAKAAKLDADDEDQKLVDEVFQSPALAKAAGEFWRAYQEAIVQLAKRSPAARKTLLELFPTGGEEELDNLWLDLIEQSGAIDALVGDAPEAARPSAGRAAWFDKLCQHLSRQWRKREIAVRAFALLRGMASALIADGKPISCAVRWNIMDIDLAELALELGVAIQPPQKARIDLDAWAARASEPEHGRDPARCAAHAQLGDVLAAAVAQFIGKDGFDAASQGKAGFVAAKRRWLEGLLEHAEKHGLPTLDEVLGVISQKVKPGTFAELPDLHARLAALDVAPLLARSLRVGIIDEFGWPELEAAAGELKADPTVHGGLPAVILASATRAIAIGPGGRLATHDFVIPPKHEFATARFIGGQFLVALKEGWRLRAYWSSSPKDIFDPEDARAISAATVPTRACVAADGSWVEGKRAIRAGERAWPEAGLAACDGTTSWITELKDGLQVMREVSASGEAGRRSWPAWIEAASAEGWRLDGAGSYVLPAPAGLERSPLGVRDGLLGVRARIRGEGPNKWTAREIERIDGKKHSGRVDMRIRELLELPGGELRPVFEETAWRQGTTGAILDETGSFAGCTITGGDRRYWRGQVAALPPILWHALTARDSAGSRRLRATTDADARTLIAALAGKTFEQLADAVPVDVVARVLPEITNERFRRGVAGMTALAAQLAVWRDKLRDERAPGKRTARALAPTGPSDDAIKEALGGWIDTIWGQGAATHLVARTGAWFTSDDRSDRVQAVEQGGTAVWHPLAVTHGVLAFLSRAFAVTPERRRTLVDLHALLRGAMPDVAKLRYWTGTRTPGGNKAQLHLLRWHGGNAYLISKQGWSDTHVHVLEYAPDGVWKVPPNFALGRERRGTSALDTLDGAPLTLDGAARLSELTGLTSSEAVYLLAGCPRMDSHDANFLPKELREQMGLKAVQAQVARDALRAVPLGKKVTALDQAGRSGATVDALAQAWTKHVGRRASIPEALIAEASDLRIGMQPSVALAMMAAPDESRELTVDQYYGIDENGRGIAVAAPAPLVGQASIASSGFDTRTLHAVCAYIPFLFAELPVGDPLRTGAVRAYELALERMRSPHFLVDLGAFNVPEDARAGMDTLLGSLGGEELKDSAPECARGPCLVRSRYVLNRRGVRRPSRT